MVMCQTRARGSGKEKKCNPSRDLPILTYPIERQYHQTERGVEKISVATVVKPCLPRFRWGCLVTSPSNNHA